MENRRNDVNTRKLGRFRKDMVPGPVMVVWVWRKNDTIKLLLNRTWNVIFLFATLEDAYPVSLSEVRFGSGVLRVMGSHCEGRC